MLTRVSSLDSSMPLATTLAETAVLMQLVYEDSSAFHRLFKRITRVTPGAYRRKMEIRVPYGMVR